MKRFGIALLSGALSLTAPLVSAQQDNTPVRIIVTFSPGGPNDIVARIAAKTMATPLGRNIIVENKPGATGAIGSQYVANASPDGNTLLLASSSTMMAPLLLKSVRFDPHNDFTPIDLIATDENLLVVHPSVPVKTVQELIALARAKPGDLNYSSSGVGSSYHLGTELFTSQLGLNMTHVPYKGTAPAVLGLIAGEVQVQFQAVSQARAHIASGKVRPLAIASLKRHPDYPDVPTIAEAANLPGFEFATWMGLFLPKGVPQSNVQQLREALAQAAKTPELRGRLAEMGMQPLSDSETGIQERISSDLKKWGSVIKDRGIVAE